MCLMFVAIPIVLIYGMIVEGFKIWYFVITCVMTLLFAYNIYWLWPLCFGELTLTEDYVKWHALFMRSVKIPYSELRHVEIRQFREGNVMRNADLYRTGQEYVLMSVDSVTNNHNSSTCHQDISFSKFLYKSCDKEHTNNLCCL